MYTLEKIEGNLLPSDIAGLPDNFVAAAVKIDDFSGKAFHAGIVIGLKGVYYIFHYTSVKIDFVTIPPSGKWYFHKNLDFITEEEVESFYVYCKLIKKEANPVYGQIFDGACYTKEGKFFSDNDIPEIMTCVGFCLNVILGFIESDEYIKYSDWDANTLPQDPNEYFDNWVKEFEEFLSEKNVDIQILKNNLRRISPDEYLAAAYIEGVPITKSEIDGIIRNVRKALIQKLD